MVGLGEKMRNVLISGSGRSGVGSALYRLLIKRGDRVSYEALCITKDEYDIYVSVYGLIRVGDTSGISQEQLGFLVDENYTKPRAFCERAISHAKPCHIILIGSIAAKYGNTGAVDYAATKAAFTKYAELRGREVRDLGIKISMVNFGGIATGFWRESMDARQIVPNEKKALTADEAAGYIVSLIDLPEHVAVKDATVVSMEYQ